MAHLLWVCIFSLFFFDMPCGHVAYLLWVCIFYFFLYSPNIFVVTSERDSHGMNGVLFVVDGWMYLLSSSVEVLHVGGRVRDLDHGCMK